MEQNTQYETHGKIMRRVAKTDTNIYGVRRVNSIPSGHLSIVIFGGEKTNTPQAANGYAKMYEQLLKFYQIHDVRVYSAYYNFFAGVFTSETSKNTLTTPDFFNSCSISKISASAMPFRRISGATPMVIISASSATVRHTRNPFSDAIISHPDFFKSAKSDADHGLSGKHFL